MKNLFKAIGDGLINVAPLPLVAGLVLAAVAIRVLPIMHRHASGPRIVTLDVVRLVNAERAAVSSMVGKSADSQQDSALALLHLGKAVKPAIRAAAGAGTIVLVKQAVISGTLPDITDQVLTALNLPLHAPTVNVAKYLGSAPTAADLDPSGHYLAARNSALLAKTKAEAKAQSAANAAAAAKAALP